MELGRLHTIKNMKTKLLLRRFVATMLLMAATGLTWADKFEVDGICYYYSSGGIFYNDNVGVTYKDDTFGSYSGDVVIPPTVTYNGTTYNVTYIHYEAFRDCPTLTSVTMPESVTIIEGGAFKGCTGLTSITIPEYVTTIEDYVFEGCTNLTDVTIVSDDVHLWMMDDPYRPARTLSEIFGNQVKHYTFGEYVGYIDRTWFGGCTSLTSVSIADGNASYDSRENCNAIIETSSNTLIFGCANSQIPKGVTIIGDESFSDCTSLTSVSIPDGVTTIGYAAFSGCTSLTSVNIPEGVTSIGAYAFSGCTGLTSVSIPDGVMSIDQGVFSGCTALTSVSIPDGVTTIGYAAFSGCTSLTSVNIPEGVTNIGAYAFYGCTDLASVNIPVSATNIGNMAFENTGWLNNHPDGLIYIGTLAYRYKGDMPQGTSIIIKDGTTEIVGSVFRGCIGLTSVTIPGSVNTIGDNAFSGCSGLTSVNIPEGVTRIGSGTFYGCAGLASVYIPASVSSIGSHAFMDCSGLTSIGVAEGNTKYDSRDNCNAIIETWSNRLIVGCQKTSFPASVTSIGSYAFSGCTGLTSVTIPASVTSIGEYAFSGCPNLTEVTINSNDIVSQDLYDPFGFEPYPMGPGCLMSGMFGEQVTKYTLGENVTGIGSGVFSYCINLVSINIPEGVTRIGEYAFEGCSNLSVVDFGSIESLCAISFGEVGSNPLEMSHRLYVNGEGLTELTIPEGVSSIGSYAFSGCTGLTSVIIPTSMTTIGDLAFEGCTALTSVTCLAGDVPRTGSFCFNQVPLADATLVVPWSSFETYKDAAQWKDFGTIVPVKLGKCGDNLSFSFDDGVLTITGEGQMYDFTEGSQPWRAYTEDITSVVISDNATSIGAYAFLGCSNLASVTIPAGITRVGKSAFVGCGLHSLVSMCANPVDYSDAFSAATYIHAPLYVPAGTYWEYVYHSNWYHFQHIKEFATEEVQTRQAYMLVDADMHYMVYDAYSGAVKTRQQVEESDLSSNWILEENDGMMFLLNLGANLYASIDSEGRMVLGDNPQPLDITFDAGVVSVNGRKMMMVINDIEDVTGIVLQRTTTDIAGETSKSEIYDITGRRLSDRPRTGLYIQGDKKHYVK